MPLQKSFSDQNHSSRSKNRLQWQRSKTSSYQGDQYRKPNVPLKPLAEKPPLPVSAATKNKLSIFQFTGQTSSETMAKTVIDLISSDDKENAIVGDESSKAIQNPEKTSTSAFEQGKKTPSTPAGKLALPDLIGMNDVQRAVQNISPDERIGWDHNKDMINTSGSFSGIKRVKKRARSSSPPSSPAQTSSHFCTRVDLRGESSNHLATDPGSEIWAGLYSLNGSKKPSPGPTIPALAQIMYTSSPQSKENNTPRSVSSFRRSNSCGNQFPKRRRVGGPGDDDIFMETSKIGPSKLSVLIERVQEGLSQPSKAPISDPPSSSPVTKTTSFEARENGSPLPQKGVEVRASLRKSPRKIQNKNLTTLEPTVHPENLDADSEFGEFDDDDLDESFLTAFDIIPEASNTSSVPPQQIQIAAAPALAKPSSTIEWSAVEDEKDEFDDSDDDAFSDLLAGLDKPKSVKKSRLKEDSDDEFGGNDFDEVDYEAVEAAATQSIQQTASSVVPSTQKARAIQRYLVTNILDNDYTGTNGRPEREKILLLQIDQTKTSKVVHLRGTWTETPVTTKAFVHVIGTFEASGRCIIDDNHNMLILHPDHLISSTVVADSFGCTRRAVLQDRVKATSASSAPLVYGIILHEIFQAAMFANRWDTGWLGELIESIAAKHLEDLYTIQLQIPQAVEYLKSKMGELQAWAELFVSSKPKPQAIVKAGNGETANMCVSKLLDVEEHVWSPMYGLKGNIDATVQVTMEDGKQERTLIVPFEVKTGKTPSAAHRAQTALYNLLLSDRYDIKIAYGILYYMETSETIRIPAIRHELRHMIMQRNELACFVRERHAQLPPMLKKENMCNRCYAQVPCFIYHKLADDGNGQTSGLKSKFDEVVKHLTPKHKEFFLKWDDLLTKEEKESLKFRRELWTMLSSEREKLGRCFSNVIIEPGSAYEELNNPKINRYRYTMIKQNPPSGFSFVESQITVGEPIVISDEKGHFALANGYVTNVRKRRITVAVDRRLHNARIRRPGFDEVDNQVFASIMEVAQEGSTANESRGKIVEESVQYRLDKDEFSNGMAIVRNNLIQVMANGPFGSLEIRSLVVDLVAPRFKTQSTAYVLQDRANINVDQRRAIEKVMSAQDYALVLGMPGTGKTTTIAHIIRALVSQGKSVLLTSYTHTAVDNILLKLKDDKIPILRLGTIAKIHSEVQEFATLAVTPKESFEEIRHAWHDSPIVATTCLGINHPIFNERTFDYCIVDEASQITLPVCLGPIRLARTFILVGDHNQLPPLVQNEEARTGGLDISLFKHLSDMHPASVIYLEHQYRMCKDIMALSNSLIYNGRLKCGSQEVANRSITIPDMDGLRQHHHTASTLPRTQISICPHPGRNVCWIRDILDPSTKVAFLNTDPLLPASREQAKGNRIVNPTEATLCTQLVESLLSVGVPASSIGVMTHYRSQLSLLKHGLRSHHDVEMHTADRFQGRDKEVIILSLVRSNQAKSIGELLKDWRRINVAFTRAKAKLLVIGSKETLKGKEGSEEMVARFVGLMEGRDWVHDVPSNALESHWFEEGGTQVSDTASRAAGTQWSKIGDIENLKMGVGEKRKWERKEKENLSVGKGMRQPKRIFGDKPLNIERMPLLRDIVNDSIG